MCGIAGIYGFKPRLPEPEAQISCVKAMTSRIVHRGPDAEGLWADPKGRCTLGHRRLSIIDTSDAGVQPMHWNRGEWSISFNGEIYNFQELKRDLEAKGIVFSGRTDTEVLLAGLAVWGEAALERIDGMFAFAALHNPTGDLLLARDPFGEKPLYYLQLDDGGFAFASELQCLEEVPGFSSAICPDAMAELLMFQYIGAPRTIYKQARKLPPGHWMRVSGRSIKTQRYFRFQPGAKGFSTASRGSLADELEDILVRSLRRRLVADVPLGAFLSGGVDSSTVCALARRKLDVPLQTFSIGFEGAKESEHELARLFSKHLGTEHRDQILVPSVRDFLDQSARLLDEPNADSSCLPTYLLSKFARQNVTVALSGDGGDELFGGYGRYLETLRESEQNAGGRWSAGNAYYSGRILIFPPDDLGRLMGFMPMGALEHHQALVNEMDADARPLLCRMRETDIENYMPGAVLPKVDRMSMQHAMEVRTPFLNVELARFAETLPPHLLMAEGKGKVLLKDIAYRYLPRDIIDMPKKGFGLPLGAGWGKANMVQALRGSLAPDARLAAWLGEDNAQQFIARQASENGFSMYQSWAVVMLANWLGGKPAEMPEREAVRACPYVPGHGLVDPEGLQIVRYYQWITPDVLVLGPPMREEPGKIITIYDVIGDVQKIPIHEKLAAIGQPLPVEGAFAGKIGMFAVSADKMTCPPDLAVIQGLHHAGLKIVGKILFLADWADFAPTPFLIQRLRTMKAKGLIVRGIHDADRAHRYYEFQYFSKIRTWLNGILLRKKGIHTWTHKNAARFGATNRYDIPVYEVEVLHRPGAAYEDYAVFEGAQQLAPVTSPLCDIEAAGGGRYAFKADGIIYSTLRASGNGKAGGSKTFSLVRSTPQTRPFLPIIVRKLPGRDMADYYAALHHLINRQHPVETNMKQERRGIVVYTHGLSSGGAERQWCNLAIGLQEIGVPVTIVVESAKGSHAHYLPLLEKARVSVIQTEDLSLSECWRMVQLVPELAPLIEPSASPVSEGVLRLACVLEQLKPSALVSQLDFTNIVAGIAGLYANVPKIMLSFRNYNPMNFSYLTMPWFLPSYQVLIQSPRVVLTGNSTVGNLDYAQWLGIDPGRITLLNNSIEKSDFSAPAPVELEALRKELGISPQDKIILGVFRLSEEKDPFTFVNVCRRTLEKVPDARVILLGEGNMMPQVKAAIAKTGLESRFHLLGRRNDVVHFLGLAHLLLLTSRFEGTPNVVLEARSFGLPVLGTKAGGIPDLVEDGVCGFLAEIGDEAALADQAVALLTEPELYERVSRKSMEKFGRFNRQSKARFVSELLGTPTSSHSYAPPH